MKTAEKKDSMLEQMNDLKKRGFDIEFRPLANNIICGEGDKKYHPGDLKIVEHYRYEGDSNPDDMSVLYALEAKDGSKGVIVNAFGIYSNPVLDDFISQVAEVKLT